MFCPKLYFVPTGEDSRGSVPNHCFFWDSSTWKTKVCGQYVDITMLLFSISFHNYGHPYAALTVSTFLGRFSKRLGNLAAEICPVSVLRLDNKAWRPVIIFKLGKYFFMELTLYSGALSCWNWRGASELPSYVEALRLHLIGTKESNLNHEKKSHSKSTLKYAMLKLQWDIF